MNQVFGRPGHLPVDAEFKSGISFRLFVRQLTIKHLDVEVVFLDPNETGPLAVAYIDAVLWKLRELLQKVRVQQLPPTPSFDASGKPLIGLGRVASWSVKGGLPQAVLDGKDRPQLYKVMAKLAKEPGTIVVCVVPSVPGAGIEVDSNGNQVWPRLKLAPCQDNLLDPWYSCAPGEVAGFKNEPAPLGVRGVATIGLWWAGTEPSGAAPGQADVTYGAKVLLHEIGHAVGLCHCWLLGDSNNIMEGGGLKNMAWPWQADAFHAAAKNLPCTDIL